MQTWKKHTNNLSDFNDVVDEFFKKINKSDVILLNGEIGTGKTTFVKRIAENLNIKQIVNSPTYSILKTYENKLCHIDSYRISNEDLDLEYYIENEYIIFIEWSDNINEYINKVDFEVNIYYQDEIDSRILEFKEY